MDEMIEDGILNGQLKEILGDEIFNYTDKPHKLKALIEQQVLIGRIDSIEKALSFTTMDDLKEYHATLKAQLKEIE